MDHLLIILALAAGSFIAATRIVVVRQKYNAAKQYAPFSAGHVHVRY
jgi:hypothetical protein